MKFDTVIIGGGLSGLVAGLDLVSHGKKVAVISAGQSALHFNSGSFELLGYDNEGRPVDSPLDAIAALEATHPYSRMGAATVEKHATRAAAIMADAGLELEGGLKHNHWRMSPMGIFKPVWLTMSDYLRVDDPAKLPWRRIALVNLKGFLDFYPQFIAAQLEPQGVKCDLVSVTVKVLEHLRENATEMRAANIARVLHGDAVDELADKVNQVSGDAEAEAVMLPAVTGYNEFDTTRRLRELVKKPLHLVATMGASVPGVRAQMMLHKQLMRKGGFYMLGDTVVRANYSGNRLRSVNTVNFGEDALQADNFIFAAGSFFSHGLAAKPDGVIEPVLGLDVDAPTERAQWLDKDLFKPQPYMKYGIATEGAQFRALRGGKPLDNVVVAGAALAGVDCLRQGSGAGVALTTALQASSTILKA